MYPRGLFIITHIGLALKKREKEQFVRHAQDGCFQIPAAVGYVGNGITSQVCSLYGVCLDGSCAMFELASAEAKTK